MESFNKLIDIVSKLRAEDGCPWDREQTHKSLKAACIEESVEVIAGIDILEETGNPESLKEELGDLLLQVVMHAQIAKEEGLFTIDDVIKGISEKMIRRHPHVFGDISVSGTDEVLVNWEEIKAKEKKERPDEKPYLAEAFKEAREFIDSLEERKT